MAEGGNGTVTEVDIVGLAQAIAAKNMEPIALKYFSISSETLENLKREHREDIEGFNRAVIRTWASRNPSRDQVQVSIRTLVNSENYTLSE